MPTKKFLIIQLYSNGDCLFATVFARQLKADFPDCTVTWAVAPFCSSILANNPYVDTVWEIDYITDRSIDTFRNNRKRLFSEAGSKGFDMIFFTQIIEENFVYYDGLVRSSLFSAFQSPITVPLTPVLELTEKEKSNIKDFVETNEISQFQFVILFECAPLSGQLPMDMAAVVSLSQKIISENPRACVILSSGNKVAAGDKRIIDGSFLSLRETAGLTHYCDLLIGSSSGITWASTSTAAREIPSIQLLNRKAYYFNSPVLDYKINNLPADRWLELYRFDDECILSCIKIIQTNGFYEAKKLFGQKSGQTFRLYRGITHQFIEKGKFRQLLKFIRRNLKLHKWNPGMIKNIVLGFILFPIQYFLNRNKK